MPESNEKTEGFGAIEQGGPNSDSSGIVDAGEFGDFEFEFSTETGDAPKAENERQKPRKLSLGEHRAHEEVSSKAIGMVQRGTGKRWHPGTRGRRPAWTFDESQIESRYEVDSAHITTARIVERQEPAIKPIVDSGVSAIPFVAPIAKISKEEEVNFANVLSAVYVVAVMSLGAMLSRDVQSIPPDIYRQCAKSAVELLNSYGMLTGSSMVWLAFGSSHIALTMAVWKAPRKAQK